jgi:glycosyltransferase involved in cell wall biosynthesis
MESIPQVIKEAFYLKIPVIATNVGGISELIKNGETGILVESKKFSSLLDEINKLLKNPILQKKLSENGHKFIIENYTWESLYQKYVDFYQNLIK